IELQKTADDLLADHTGALVLMTADTGDSMVMASHPTYDPNLLDDIWGRLIQDVRAPLLNRAIQGRYPTGDLGMILFPDGAPASWLDTVPLRLPGSESQPKGDVTNPLAVVMLAASLSSAGIQPAPRIAQAYQNPQGEWVLLPSLGNTGDVLTPENAQSITESLKDPHTPAWHLTLTPAGEEITWYLGGTLPGADGKSLAVVVVLETSDLPLAEQIGAALLLEALTP
ncbi:MAG: hypothetical protein ISS57_02225, partial [Anaerolineales bacterium]|nr:hypothetical protein [Anaerolineales bacterium]